MIQFKPAPHTQNEADVIEVWMDGIFIAAIYPHGDSAIKVVSKHIDSKRGVVFDTFYPSAVIIPFRVESTPAPPTYQHS